VTFDTFAGEQEKTMKNIRAMRLFIVGAMLAAYGAGAAAQAEVEPNYPVASAQPLAFDASDTAMVSAFLGSGDADLFSFSAREGDVVTVDIDGGIKAGAGSVDTFVGVHHPASMNYVVLRAVDDAAAVDPGSLGTEDSYIQNLVIPADGVYVVSVAGYPNQVSNGAVLLGGPGNATGSYTLIVTFVSRAPVAEAPAPEAPAPVAEAPAPATEAPAPDPVAQDPAVPEPEAPVAQPEQVLQVGIDIKPGQRGVARINPKSRHDIPVALLSSRDFDAMKVDVSSLTFGSTGDERSLAKCYKRGVHVNRDRRRDLLCLFENDQANFETTDEEAILRGVTEDGTPFEARGMLKVVAEKRRSWHSSKRHDHDDDRKRHRHHRHR